MTQRFYWGIVLWMGWRGTKATEGFVGVWRKANRASVPNNETFASSRL
jgi:hypothetical protein